MGLDQGFDTYDSPFNFEAFSPISGEMFFGGTENPYWVRDRRDGALVVRAALRWMAANRDQPVFVFIHLFDLYTPYIIPEASAQRKGISRYDTQLEYEDEVIGRLVGQVAGHSAVGSRRGTWRSRLIEPWLFHLPEHATTSAGDLSPGPRASPASRPASSGLLD